MSEQSGDVKKNPGADQEKPEDRKRSESVVSKAASTVMNNMTSENLSKAAAAVAPVVEKIVELVQKCLPIAEKYYKKAGEFYQAYLAEFHTAELTELFFGFTLLFLGGNFALTLACYTAIRLSGWETLKESCMSLYDCYRVSKDQIEKDLKKELDTDGDGKVSAVEMIKAMQKQENINKLTFTLLKALDPQKMIEAFKGLWIVLLSVVATLRTQFAQQVTIGANIGAVLQESLESFAEPELKNLLRTYDESYEKWSNFIIVCISRVVCISICMMLTRIITAYHSALQGGKIIARNVLNLLVKRKVMNPRNRIGYKKNAEPALIILLSFFGLYWQMSSFFHIPLLLRLPMMPFLWVESLLGVLAIF